MSETENPEWIFYISLNDLRCKSHKLLERSIIIEEAATLQVEHPSENTQWDSLDSKVDINDNFIYLLHSLRHCIRYFYFYFLFK